MSATDETVHAVRQLSDAATVCGLVVDDLRYQVAQATTWTPSIECPRCRVALRLPRLTPTT